MEALGDIRVTDSTVGENRLAVEKPFRAQEPSRCGSSGFAGGISGASLGKGNYQATWDGAPAEVAHHHGGMKCVFMKTLCFL